jgi:hypothetical protein
MWIACVNVSLFADGNRKSQAANQRRMLTFHAISWFIGLWNGMCWLIAWTLDTRFLTFIFIQEGLLRGGVIAMTFGLKVFQGSMQSKKRLGTDAERESRMTAFAVAYFIVNFPLAVAQVVGSFMPTPLPFEVIACGYAICFLGGLFDVILLSTHRLCIYGLLRRISAPSSKQFSTPPDSLAEPFLALRPISGDFTIPFAALTIGSRIGSGSSGIVFRGFLVGVHEPVAIKQLIFLDLYKRLGDFDPTKNLAEFRNESSLLAKLRHPNIILLYGICITQGPFLVMELCALSLGAFLRSANKCTMLQRLHLATQAASALHFLHAKQIAHCDVKGENILLTSNMQVRLCDFGISRHLVHTMASEVPFGTPAYMSPEMWYTVV